MTFYEEKRCDEPHYHTTTEDVVYILHGKLHILNITTGKTNTFTEGDIVVIPVITPYVAMAETGTLVIFVKNPTGNDKKVVDISDMPDVVKWMQD